MDLKALIWAGSLHICILIISEKMFYGSKLYTLMKGKKYKLKKEILVFRSDLYDRL